MEEVEGFALLLTDEPHGELSPVSNMVQTREP